jgi:hypothetical protein
LSRKVGNLYPKTGHIVAKEEEEEEKKESHLCENLKTYFRGSRK